MVPTLGPAALGGPPSDRPRCLLFPLFGSTPYPYYLIYCTPSHRCSNLSYILAYLILCRRPPMIHVSYVSPGTVATPTGHSFSDLTGTPLALPISNHTPTY